MRQLLLSIGIVVAIAYTAICLLLFFQQTRFIFFPSPQIQTTPEFFNLRYQEVWVPVPTGDKTVERMHGWWIPATQPNPKVLLYLHGNGINIGANVAHAYRFHQLGFSVLLIDYRGYGRSEGGFPTETRVYQDAAAAWDYLVKERQIQPSEIFLYGHSLGGAIAIALAMQHSEAAGLIVESSFTSIRQIVEHQNSFWMFPVDLILTQRFDSISKVRSLLVPVLFIHGTADWQVPAFMSQQLYAAAPEPKQLVLIPGAGHNDVAEVAGSQYFHAVQKFVEQVLGACRRGS
jgi:pimeloyl-ACP methyl ester carboxylesterase